MILRDAIEYDYPSIGRSHYINQAGPGRKKRILWYVQVAGFIGILHDVTDIIPNW